MGEKSGRSRRMTTREYGLMTSREGSDYSLWEGAALITGDYRSQYGRVWLSLREVTFLTSRVTHYEG